MSKLEISSSFFNNDSDFWKYVKELSFVKDDDDFNEVMKFIELNNHSIIETFGKYKKYLIYGDVQSGKTNNLIYITEKVVSKYNYNFIIFLAGTKNDLMFQNQERFFESFEKMNGSKYNILNSRGFGKKKTSIYNYIKDNDKVAIIHSLKRPDTLEMLYKTLASVEGEKRILVIDDEGDEASLSPKTMSSIKLFDNFKHTKYISITATPFNNLASKMIDYDYYHVLKSPKTYTSLKKMEDCFVSVEKNNFDCIVKPLIEFADTVSKNNRKEAQILFNLFNTKSSHNEINELIQKYINDFSSISILNDLKNQYPIEFDSKKIAMFFRSIDSRNIITSNGDNENVTRMKIEVIIGGLKLSRGLTFKNLISEVMLNMGSEIKASTLIQRARWLGHRGPDVELIKVYATNAIQEAFKEARHLIKWTKNYHIHEKDYATKFKNSEYKRIKL